MKIIARTVTALMMFMTPAANAAPDAEVARLQDILFNGISQAEQQAIAESTIEAHNTMNAAHPGRPELWAQPSYVSQELARRDIRHRTRAAQDLRSLGRIDILQEASSAPQIPEQVRTLLIDWIIPGRDTSWR